MIRILIFILFIGSNTMAVAQQNSSFQLNRGAEYVVSAWVKETKSSTTINYTSSRLDIKFGNSTANYSLVPSGKIINGWQRVVGVIKVPALASNFDLNLISEVTDGYSYFDDIRVFPVNGSMKSFVYDPDSQRLMAELDENNYATFYEYDREGGLVRVKKETERGVYTIQETRSSNTKTNQL